MNKKFLLFLVILVLIISACNKEKLNEAPNQNNIKLVLPNETFETFCDYTEFGWTCSVDTSIDIFQGEIENLIKKGYICTNQDNGVQNCKINLSENPTFLIKQFENDCISQGGKWVCYGYCLPEYKQYCDFPLNDAGKSCEDSSQCKGKCITDNENCKQSCIGKCSEYPLRICDFYNEIVKGNLEQNRVICD